MKKLRNLVVLLFAVFAVIGFTGTAIATPFMPPLGPIYLDMQNWEQISQNNMIVSPENNAEGNWGVFRVPSLFAGDTTLDPQNFNAGSTLWTELGSGHEITGIFGGITALPWAGGAAPFDSQNGTLRIYYDETPDHMSAPVIPVSRWADGNDLTFPNFTDGVLLAEISFLNGGIAPGVSIRGSTVLVPGGVTGIADAFGVVNDVNSDGVIDENDGLWAEYLANHYFHTALGLNTADIKLRTIYSYLPAWNDPGFNVTNDIIGADSTDPVRGHVTPEPATMLLLGVGLLGLAGLGRKRFMKKA